MFTVAMIGPDGVGKTSVSRQLEQSLPMPAKYLYMGVNVDASNVALPTSRWIHWLRGAIGKAPNMGGPLDPQRIHQYPAGWFRRRALELKRCLRLMNQLSEEWFRQFVIHRYLRRGYVVLLDRDFFADYYAYDITDSASKRSLTRRIHGFVLRRFYRRPDLMICLDADAETMFARKGEGTIELLEQRRRDYMQLDDVVEHFAVVNANHPLDVVTQEVRTKICEFCKRKANTAYTVSSSL